MKKKIGIAVFVILLAIGIVFVCSGGRVLDTIGISSTIFKTGGKAYGDVNEDGKVNTEDALLVLQDVAGNKKLTDLQKNIADVDGDGKITQIDAQLILKKTVKLLKKFPIEEGNYGFEPGDVNQDKVVNLKDVTVTLQYLEGKCALTEYQKVLANVSGDSEITKLDAELIQRYYAGRIKAFPIINAKVKYYSLADVDENGTVNTKDATMIQQYLANMRELSEIQCLAADVNGDGKISQEDAEMILQIVVGNMKVPEKSEDTNSKDQEEDQQQSPSQSSPNENVNPTPQVPDSQVQPSTPTPILYGDVYEDGQINSKDALMIQQYLANMKDLNERQRLAADVNGDEIVDALDAELVLKYVTKIIQRLHPSEQYYILGDVYQDGKVSNKDATMIQQYLVKTRELDEVQKKAADYNQDGRITQDDVLAILRYCANH